MSNKSSNRYYVKNTENGTFQDITTLFDGVAVLKVDGFLAKGKPVNIYTAQWIDSQVEDFLITKETTVSNTTTPVVVRENTDIDITFIIRKKYATTQTNFDALSVHDAFVDYMTNTDVWIKSSYVGNKYVHCVCLKEYKPTNVKLQRGDSSWIMGTLTLHCLDAPTT